MDSRDKSREIVIHQSLNRANQLMGGDRELVLISILTSVALGFSLASWWGLGLALACYSGAMAVLRRMGKADPMMRHVYMRHIRYRAFYPAKSGLYSRCLQVPMKWR
jgi:type IV secretory pathway TrbD component